MYRIGYMLVFETLASLVLGLQAHDLTLTQAWLFLIMVNYEMYLPKSPQINFGRTASMEIKFSSPEKLSKPDPLANYYCLLICF